MLCRVCWNSNGYNAYTWLHVAYSVAILLFGLVPALAQSNSAASPPPSPSSSDRYLGPGSLSTGYLAVVFGVAFVLVSFTFCTSYCVRIWYLHRPDVSGGSERRSVAEAPLPLSPPAPQGPPPVVVIQPDKEISCAELADPELQEELTRTYLEQPELWRGHSRYVEIDLNAEDGGELSVKQAALGVADSHANSQFGADAQQAAHPACISRMLCFWRQPGRGPGARTDAAAQEGMELGVQHSHVPVSELIGNRQPLGGSTSDRSLQELEINPGGGGSHTRPDERHSADALPIPTPELRVQQSGFSFSAARGETLPVHHPVSAQPAADVLSSSQGSSSASATAPGVSLGDASSSSELVDASETFDGQEAMQRMTIAEMVKEVYGASAVPAQAADAQAGRTAGDTDEALQGEFVTAVAVDEGNAGPVVQDMQSAMYRPGEIMTLARRDAESDELT